MHSTQSVEKMPKNLRFDTDKRKDSKRDKQAPKMKQQAARRAAAAAQNHKPVFVFS